jgi:hypothetical protein
MAEVTPVSQSLLEAYFKQAMQIKVRLRAPVQALSSGVRLVAAHGRLLNRMNGAGRPFWLDRTWT